MVNAMILTSSSNPLSIMLTSEELRLLKVCKKCLIFRWNVVYKKNCIAEKPDICSFSQSPRTMVFQFQLALPHNSRKGWKLYGFRSGVIYALYSVIDFSFLLVSSPIVGLFTIFFNSILNPCFIRTRRWQVHWVRDWKGSRSILDRIKHSKQVLPTWIWQIEQFNWRRFLVR